MKLHIVAVGRLKSGPERTLISDYLKRLPWPLVETEVEERKPLERAVRQGREGELLLAALPQGALVVALDAAGQTLSSEAFALKLDGWRAQGRDVAFIIGGSDGLAAAALARADLKLSLGAMTWPHALARVLLVEQIYRAYAIQSGHPYHK